MNTQYDVAIIGAGAHGSAAAYHLSKTKNKILVIDKFEPPHTFGSSHGQSRIIREAYFESPVYVPLVQQAYKLWDELEKESGKKLLLHTGGLMMGAKDSAVVQGALQSALQYNLPYEYLEQEEIKNRYPAFKPAKETVALFEERAGILFPEKIIETNIALARKGNVDLNFNENVTNISSDKNEIKIVTNKNTYTANKLIVSAGAWTKELLPEVNLPLQVERTILYWFKNKDKNRNAFLPESFPIYIWEYEKNKMVYGFPELGDGIKIAFHHSGSITTANNLNRNVTKEEINSIEKVMKKCLNIDASFNYAVVCMYTNTPDENFIIDYHPQNENIIIASPCSGHAFKFSSAIGKLLCNMAINQDFDIDIKPFRMMR